MPSWVNSCLFRYGMHSQQSSVHLLELCPSSFCHFLPSSLALSSLSTDSFFSVPKLNWDYVWSLLVLINCSCSLASSRLAHAWFCSTDPILHSWSRHLSRHWNHMHWKIACQHLLSNAKFCIPWPFWEDLHFPYSSLYLLHDVRDPY